MAERIQKGLPAEPEMIRHLIFDAKLRERDKKHKKETRQADEAWKRGEADRARQRRKDEDERQCKEAAAQEIAQRVANILVARLDADEITKVNAALDDFYVTGMLHRALTIIESGK